MNTSKEFESDFHKLEKKIVNLQLNKISYEENDTHIVKLLTILKIILKNGPTSKWDLATVPYRNTTKNGLTQYSWVLVHKIILELLKFDLVQKCGKSNDKKINKKQDVYLYYPTVKGIIFVMCADKKSWLFNLNNENNNFRFHKLTSSDKENILTLTKVLWQIQHIDPLAGNEIRIFTMNNILTTDSNIIENILLYPIIEYAFKIFQDFNYKNMDNKEGSTHDELMKIIAIKSALSRIENEQIRKILGTAFVLKIEKMKFSMHMAEWIFDDFGELPISVQRDVSKLKNSLDQLFLRSRVISDLGTMYTDDKTDSLLNQIQQLEDESESKSEVLKNTISSLDFKDLDESQS